MGGVFAAIGRFFSNLLAKLVGAVEWIGKLFVQVFIDLWEIVTDLAVWAFDAALGVAVAAIAALDVSGVQSAVGGAWASLPGEVLNILGLIGLHYCLGIIGAAILIRLTLQLIPFTRLGS